MLSHNQNSSCYHTYLPCASIESISNIEQYPLLQRINVYSILTATYCYILVVAVIIVTQSELMAVNDA